MSRLFRVPSVVIRSAWVFCLGLSMVLYQGLFASARAVDVNMHQGKIQVVEVRTGSFQVGGRDFTLIRKVLRWEGAINGYEETVQSITIVDSEGISHFQKSFKIDQGETAFMESVEVSAFSLDSRGLKGFRVEGGELKQLPQNDRPGAGLIVYYGVLPTAPLSGAAIQIFVLKGDRLTPLFSPLAVYGQIYELPQGSTQGSRRLFQGDTMKFGVWTGWFEVIVPLRVFDNLKVEPLHFDMTSRQYALEVVVERSPSNEATFVRLYRSPAQTGIPKHVIVRKDSKIEFLLAYAKPAMSKGRITLDGVPWLKVRIDGREGYVRDPEDLMALGIRQAG